jgi:hypothetical protein
MKRREPKIPDRVVVETFGFPGYLVRNLQTSNRREPFCFNDEVGFERYRVTVERVEESADILFERLVELWETTDNFHHWTPLKDAAEKIGRKFTTQPGSRRERSR